MLGEFNFPSRAQKALFDLVNGKKYDSNFDLPIKEVFKKKTDE